MQLLSGIKDSSQGWRLIWSNGSLDSFPRQASGLSPLIFYGPTSSHLPSSMTLPPQSYHLLAIFLLFTSPSTILASPPASIGSLLCSGTFGFLIGTGAGMGLGYLVFGWRFRNSIGIWKGDQGFGIWGRKKRETLNGNDPDIVMSNT